VRRQVGRVQRRGQGDPTLAVARSAGQLGHGQQRRARQRLVCGQADAAAVAEQEPSRRRRVVGGVA
jgi:hypothetical protein